MSVNATTGRDGKNNKRPKVKKGKTTKRLGLVGRKDGRTDGRTDKRVCVNGTMGREGNQLRQKEAKQE